MAGLPAPPHPSKLPTSSSIFDNVLTGGAGRTTAFGDLSASLPPYLGNNIGFPGTGDGLYGAGNTSNGLGEVSLSKNPSPWAVKPPGAHHSCSLLNALALPLTCDCEGCTRALAVQHCRVPPPGSLLSQHQASFPGSRIALSAWAYELQAISLSMCT